MDNKKQRKWWFWKRKRERRLRERKKEKKEREREKRVPIGKEEKWHMKREKVGIGDE